jgi:hypothetical protein
MKETTYTLWEVRSSYKEVKLQATATYLETSKTKDAATKEIELTFIALLLQSLIQLGYDRKQDTSK